MENPRHPVMHDYDLEEALPYLLNRAGVRIGEAFSLELRRFGITLQTWRVLASLAHRDGQTLSELSDHTSIELSTLSRLVGAMEKIRQVERRANPEDKRSWRFHLTSSGVALVSQIIPMATLYERIPLVGISPEEARLLKRLLTKVYDNVATFNGGGSS